MQSIKNYTNTKCELEMARARLNWLMDKKEKLYCKYFPVTVKPKELRVDGGQSSDKMSEYLQELYEVDLGTGRSLASEIEEQQINIDKIETYLLKMNKSLSEMKGLEYQLFYEIVVNGTNISKAVDKIAEENNKESNTIWKNYYRKIKNELKKIENLTKRK